MIGLSYHLENVSFLMGAIARHQLVTSMLGLAGTAALAWAWRRRSPRVKFAIWMTFLVWLILTGLLKPGLWLPVHSPGNPDWLTTLASHPCDTPIYERFSNALPGPPILSWQGLAVLIWAGIAVWLGSRHIRRRRHFQRLVAGSAPITCPHWQERLQHWRQHFGVRRRISLLQSEAAPCAFTLGLRHPAIILPGTLFRALHPADLESVIVHELAHVKRLDDFWLRLQELAQALFFFCPSTWFLGRRLYRLREHCCDLLAANTLGVHRYGCALLNVARLQSPGRKPLPGLALDEQGSFLEQRIRTLTNPPTCASAWLPIVTTALLLCALSLLTAFRPVTADIFPADESQRILDELMPMAPLEHGYLSKGFIGGDTVSCWLSIASNHPHPALDIQPTKSGSVLAVADGVVESVVRGIGSYAGMIIVVRHRDDVLSSYSHLHSSAVRRGDGVARGQPLGMLNHGQNLHFELYRGSRRVDLSSVQSTLSGSAR